MDLSFEIDNGKGDIIMVSLSSYDTEVLLNFTCNPNILTLDFYDVSIFRVKGVGKLGYGALSKVSEILASFLNENKTAVLCFMCDEQSDVERRHTELLPQEYRSDLFSHMFEAYVKKHGIENLYVNQKIVSYYRGYPTIGHFITPTEYLKEIIEVSNILNDK